LLFLSVFHQTWIFLTDFSKILKIKLNENPSSGSRVVPCGRAGGRTDGHGENNSRCLQVCEGFLMLLLGLMATSYQYEDLSGNVT
jgi:hypothetical protein